MSPGFLVYSNSEYVYATFPIALSLFRGKGGEEICLSKPLSAIFTILPHCLNTTATNNYSVRTNGKWSCEDAILKGSAPLEPLAYFEKYPIGSKPRASCGTAPGTFYNSLFALILATLRFKEMSRGAPQGHERLTETEFNDIELGKKKGPQAVNLLSVFVTSEGGNLPGDFSSGDLDLETLLLEGKIEALARTDSCVWHDSNIDKNTSWRYNYFSKQYVGNYRNWVFARQVKDWAISSYKASFDILQELAKESFLVNIGNSVEVLGGGL